MVLRLSAFLILVMTHAIPAIADKYEPFDDSESAASHGWSILSPTTDFAANVISTSRAAGASGPGEAEIIVKPAFFSQNVFFADTDLGGTFTLDDDFSFSGNLKLEGLDPGDSMHVIIGFFDSDAARDPTPYTRPPYVGIVIGGGYGSPFYFEDGFVGAGNGRRNGGEVAYLPKIDSSDPIPISMQFTADFDGGSGGNIAVTFGSQSTGYVLVEYQNDDPTFDAFGVLVWGSISDAASDFTIVLDDLRYSTPIPEPTSLLLLVTAGSYIGNLRRRQRIRTIDYRVKRVYFDRPNELEFER